MKNGLLYRIENVTGCKTGALLIPVGRRKQVLKLAHEMFGVHLASVETRNRIRLSGMTWSTLISDCKAFMRSCKPCQLHSRVPCFDRVKIKAIERADDVYNHGLPWTDISKPKRSMQLCHCFS
jgi:Integrase zinc binding domain